jgi:hypothetical protein
MQAFPMPKSATKLDCRPRRWPAVALRFCSLLPLTALPLAGCDGGVGPEELGHVIYDARELPGATSGQADSEAQDASLRTESNSPPGESADQPTSPKR